MKTAVVSWRGLIALVVMALCALVSRAPGQCGPAWLHLWPPTDVGGVESLITHDGRLYVAGDFEWIGDQNIPYLAVWDGLEWSAPAHTPPGPVREVLEWRGGLVLRGEFVLDGGQTYTELVRATGDGYEALAGPLDRVVKLGLFQDDLVVIVQNAPDQLGLWRFDGVNWMSMGTTAVFEREFSDLWLALQEYRGELYLGSAYHRTDPMWVLRKYVGKAWLPVARISGQLLTGVAAMTVYNDELVIAGDFESVNRQPMRSIAAWNGQSWHGFGDGLDDYYYHSVVSVESLAVLDGMLCASGTFDNSGGVDMYPVARWNGVEWEGIRANYTAWRMTSLAAFGHGLVFGGADRGYNFGVSRYGRYTPTNIPWIARQPEDVESAPGATLVLRCRSAADYAAEFRWSRQGIPLSDGATGHGSVISGSATHELVVSNLSACDAGGYTCEVWNECGGETSRVAMVTLCRADLNADGFVNGNDYDLFADAFDTADPAADFNSDGFVNADDYDAFAEAFEGGC